jgi:hypothetical protein
MCTPYKVSDEDAKYRYVLPKKWIIRKNGYSFLGWYNNERS